MLEMIANLCQIACLLSSQCESCLALSLDIGEKKVETDQSDAMMHFSSPVLLNICWQDTVTLSEYMYSFDY